MSSHRKKCSTRQEVVIWDDTETTNDGEVRDASTADGSFNDILPGSRARSARNRQGFAVFLSQFTYSPSRTSDDANTGAVDTRNIESELERHSDGETAVVSSETFVESREEATEKIGDATATKQQTYVNNDEQESHEKIDKPACKSPERRKKRRRRTGESKDTIALQIGTKRVGSPSKNEEVESPSKKLKQNNV